MNSPKYTNGFNVRDELKFSSVERIKATRKPKNFAVATFNLKGDLNLGSIMRTAEITGAKDFFILGHRSWDRRSAVGVQNYINVEKHEECIDYKTTSDMLVTKNYIPVVAEQGGYTLLQFKREWDAGFIARPGQMPCFIFGPEDTGFGDDWIKPRVSLLQTGVSRSYNVSSAAAIILYNWSFS